MRDPAIVVDRNEFDCRRYVLIGDVVEYKSIICCTDIKSAQKHESVLNKAVVYDSYEKFVVVKFKNKPNGDWKFESVNRWNLTKINGRAVGNNSGWFGNMIARA